MTILLTVSKPKLIQKTNIFLKHLWRRLPNQLYLDTSAWQFWSINGNRATSQMQFCAHTPALSHGLPPPPTYTRIRQQKKGTFKKAMQFNNVINNFCTSAAKELSWGLALHTTATTAERKDGLQEFCLSPLSTAAWFCTDREFNFTSLNCLWIGKWKNCGKSPPSTRSSSCLLPTKAFCWRGSSILIYCGNTSFGSDNCPSQSHTLPFFITDTDELQQPKLYNIK